MWKQQRLNATPDSRAMWKQQRLNATPDSRAMWKQQQLDATPDSRSMWKQQRLNATPNSRTMWKQQWLNATPDSRTMWKQQRLNATPDSRTMWKPQWSDDFENRAVWTRHNARSCSYYGLQVFPEHAVINKDDLLTYILLLGNFSLHEIPAALYPALSLAALGLNRAQIEKQYWWRHCLKQAERILR